MITYKEFINRMIEKGYQLNNGSPITIDNKNEYKSEYKNEMINTFFAKKGQTGKIVELYCPDNNIIALCGTTHIGGCDNEYSCNIRCYNSNEDEPFQELHDSTALSKNNHVVAEIIVTKILQKEPPKDNKKVKEWSEKISPILNIIKSENSLEHVMWVGAYKLLSTDFVKTSFTLYGDQKMIFYINNPDIDIINVSFEMKVDIFQKV